MPTEYVQDAELDNVVKDLVDRLEEFSPIKDTSTRIAAVLLSKFDKEENLEPGRVPSDAKKVSPLFETLTEGSHYVVVVDAYAWQHASVDDREILVHVALMKMDVSVDHESGKIKRGSRHPDIKLYSTTIKRYKDQLQEMGTIRSCLEYTALCDVVTPEAEAEAEAE